MSARGNRLGILVVFNVRSGRSPAELNGARFDGFPEGGVFGGLRLEYAGADGLNP